MKSICYWLIPIISIILTSCSSAPNASKRSYDYSTESTAPLTSSGTEKNGGTSEPDSTTEHRVEESAKPQPKQPTREIRKSELKAGSHNDNEEFVRYLQYLERFAYLDTSKLDVAERYILQIKDTDGKPIPNCNLTIRDSAGVIASLTTYSSGEAVLFPNTLGKRFIGDTISVNGVYQNQPFTHTFPRGVCQVIPISIGTKSSIPQPLPIDILFLLDTTGSMSDEIQKLKDTLVSIHHKITQVRIAVAPRFGMVLYRDIGDAYVTKVFDLTGDLEHFQRLLDEVEANGGGDKPEEMEEALKKSLTEIAWNPNGIRLIFAITDAAPHLDRSHSQNYVWAMQTAAQKGIKIYTIGTSGLDEVGEYVLRQLALFTQAHYLFLTYGEQGESSDSPQAKTSHHTGENYAVVPLDILVVRMIRQELSYLVNPELIREEVIPTPMQINAASLTERIHNLVEQIHYPIQKRLVANPLIAVFPLNYEPPQKFKNVAQYIKDTVEQELKSKECKLLEREELQKAIRERMISAGDTLDEKAFSEITKMQGADIYLSGKVYPLGESVVLFMQIVDVASLQKLAVARVLWTPE